ncbi:MAG: hypothetical protein DHS20C21_12080 [Gemmatimonadota bacterium]|nr:MAG: hypothetical protein DHS20C21_12080 [Gemmatimonadota bacterium]
MAKRTYYSFEKRQKELKKQQKKEAKAELKRLKLEAKEAGMTLEAWLEQEGLETPEGMKDEDEDDFSGLGIENLPKPPAEDANSQPKRPTD